MKNTILLFVILLFVANLSAQNTEDDLFIYPAQVKSVHDGDTYRIRVKVPKVSTSRGGRQFKWTLKKVRLYSCDTYELKSRNRQHLEKAKEAKKMAKYYLENYPFVIQFRHFDLNNRWVCKIIFQNGKTLKQILKDANLLTGKYEHF